MTTSLRAMGFPSGALKIFMRLNDYKKRTYQTSADPRFTGRHSRLYLSVTLGNTTGRRLGRHRQDDLHARSALCRSCHLDAPVVRDDNFLNQREAEPRAAALGREERREDSLALGRRNAGTVVVHRH